MYLRCFFVLTLLPLLDLFLLVFLIPSFVTITWTVLSGMMGASLFYVQGRLCWKQLSQNPANTGVFQAFSSLDSAIILVGAALLMSPGILTDLLGLLLLFPLSRMIFVSYVGIKLQAAERSANHSESSTKKPDTIDV